MQPIKDESPPSSPNRYESVPTAPVKRFFVSMLTRDIGVEDAILDLLDNCIDGVQRSIARAETQEAKSVGSNSDLPVDGIANTEPYMGFWAKITVNKDRFAIEDNCGGIPWSEHNRAFRMGRLERENDDGSVDPPLSVGVYGIGMKRAIFKMGDEATISTRNGSDSYRVPISVDWVRNEFDWNLPVIPDETDLSIDGTKITVSHLHDGIEKRFAAEKFDDDLVKKINSHYAAIIQKGFRVEVNGILVKPTPVLFRFSEEGTEAIRPYVFRTTWNEVEVIVAVGLREPIPDAQKMLDEQITTQLSTETAGWTIICNDRVVLYCNKDELTGWGTSGLPRYHTQFRAISGVVEFRGPADKLPTTTTKRGLDYSSSLYLQVLERMREGLRVFIDFTNNWKSREEDARAKVSPVPAVTFGMLKKQVGVLPFHKVQSPLGGEQFKPKLPKPPVESPDVRLSFFREKDEVFRLGEELIPHFEELKENEIPRKVGEASFDFAYQRYFGDGSHK